MPLVTVSTKGQIIIPAEIRKKHAIKQGDRFEVQVIDGKIVLIPVKTKPLVGLYGTLRGKTSLVRSLQEEHAKEIEKDK